MSSRIGFMQGRLCDMVDGKIQAFPWEDWESEFSSAYEIDLGLMEWTLDQEDLYQNPLMTISGQEKIRSLCQKHQMSIPSLTGDCFMQAPFWKATDSLESELKKDFVAICDACSEIGIEMIVIPLVDNGSLENIERETKLIDFLLTLKSFFEEKNLKILFESDFRPDELRRFIGKLPEDLFGVNYDIGNSAALGFNSIEEFSAFGSRILNVHVKDRVLGGTTVSLGSGDADFETVFSGLKKIKYQGNYILQTARAADQGHAEAIVRYRDLVQAWAV